MLMKARAAAPSEISIAISTMNSSTMTQASKRCSARTPGAARRRATSTSQAAEIEVADTTSSMPSSVVSAQIGRLVTASSTPVYNASTPHTAPAAPPAPAMPAPIHAEPSSATPAALSAQT